MRLMVPGHASKAFLALTNQYPERLGWLLSPDSWRLPKVPYALDNGAYAAFKNRCQFDFDGWRSMLDKVPMGNPPLWVLVPDVVANRDLTIEWFDRYHTEITQRHWPVAFAVQDGMTKEDVPSQTHTLFVGGSTHWKWNSAKYWCSHFPRVHIGRVNGTRRLWIAQRLGATSCDGSGYFRATLNGLEGRKLQAWLHHEHDPQIELPSVKDPTCHSSTTCASLAT